MGRRAKVINLLVFAILFQDAEVRAFDGSDASPPRVTSMKSLLSPSKENDWKMAILIVTEDDKNWVLKPKMNLQIAFPWAKVAQAPPPKCQSIARISVPLDVLEVDQLRLKRQGSNNQTFIAFGRVPMLAKPVENCIEIRDFLAKPIIALNGRGIITSVRGGDISPTYSGGLFEPSLEDESGRTSSGNVSAREIKESDLTPREWPQVPRFLCFSQRELGILVNRLSFFSELTDEMNRSIELGNEFDLSPEKEVANFRNLILEYANLAKSFDANFISLNLCDSTYTSSQVLGMIKSSISRIKKSNDDFVKQIATLNRDQDRAKRERVIAEQNSLLSEKDSLLKSVTSQHSALALEYEKITKTQTQQTSGVSFGSKVNQKRVNVNLKKKRTDNQLLISQNKAKLNELDMEMGIAEAEKNTTSDKSLRAFLEKYSKKLEQIRSMMFKILMTLLKFDKYYLDQLS